MVQILKKGLLPKKSLEIKKSEILEEYSDPDPSESIKLSSPEGDYKKFISTGSTLLDLSIGGLRKRGGGIPSGMIVEIFGPNGCGKSAILAEGCASAQSQKGHAAFLDPEGRLDKQYSEIYGMDLKKGKGEYHMPSMVDQVFDYIRKDFKPPSNAYPAVIATDALAALCGRSEMEGNKPKKDGEEGTVDKMAAMRRAADFSQGFRKIAVLLAEKGWIMLCSNQIRHGPKSKFTPTGEGVKFHASIRIEMTEPYPRTNKFLTSSVVKVRGVKQTEVYGIKSHCKVVKSSKDKPYRECDIYIVFGYGIDDIRGNLQYIKDNTGTGSYVCPDGQSYISMRAAIDYVEKNKLVIDLKEQTIDLWEEIQHALIIPRVPKRR